MTYKPDFKVIVLLLVFMQLTRDLFAIAKFLCTFGTCVVRNFKFGKLVDFGMSHLIDDKIFPLGGCGGLSATDN